MWPMLRAFNSVLTASCVLDELEVGVGCMGIIEYAFAGISATIGGAVVRHGWVKADELVHYKLHAAIDERPTRKSSSPSLSRTGRIRTAGITSNRAWPWRVYF